MPLPSDPVGGPEHEPSFTPEAAGVIDAAEENGEPSAETTSTDLPEDAQPLPQSWAERGDLATLPHHIEAALKSFLGEDDLATYGRASADERRALIADRIASLPSVETAPAEETGEPTLNDAAARGEILDRLFDQSVAEMAASRLTSAEGWTDNLAWTNRVVGSLRTLGLRDAAWRTAPGLGGNALKVGTLIGVGAVTSVALKTGEHLAGSGGVVGMAAGALGYQQMYQRNLDNRWQRGQHVAVTVAARLTRPLRFLTTKPTEIDQINAQIAHEEIPDEQKGLLAYVKRSWRSVQVAATARHEANTRRAQEEESRVHLREEQVGELDKPALLQRLAEGRLALTRQDRREQNWRGHQLSEGQRKREIELYSALVKRAALVCSPDEVASAIGRTSQWSKVHLAASLGAGALGAAAGFFGGRWLAQEIKGSHQPAAASSGANPPAEATAPAPRDLPRLVTPESVVTSPEHIGQPLTPDQIHKHALEALDWRTAQGEPTAWELSRASHAVRANILHHLGAGEYQGDKFVLKGEYQFTNAAGDGWVKVRIGEETITLPIHGGKTDLSPLAGRGVVSQDQLREVGTAITRNRIASLQEEVTGRNLVREYTGGANHDLIHRAEEVKNELIRGLVDRSETGELKLAPAIQQELASAGYDFNVSDVHSLNDAHQEVHQAMSRWFAHQASTVNRPAVPVRVPAAQHWVTEPASAPTPSNLERQIFAPSRPATPGPKVEVSLGEPHRATPNVNNSGPRGGLETVPATGRPPRPYTGWRGLWEQPRATNPPLSGHPDVQTVDLANPTATPTDAGPHLATPDTHLRQSVPTESTGHRVSVAEPPRTTVEHTPRSTGESIKPVNDVPPPVTAPRDSQPALAEPSPAPRAPRVEVSRPPVNDNLEDLISGSRLERLTEEDIEEVVAPAGQSN